jgi:hypothetical protein
MISWRKHEMSTFEFQKKARDLVAGHCFACIRNEIGGLKGKAFRKAFPNTFQVVDMLDEIDDSDIMEVVNDTEKDKEENAGNTDDSGN